MKHTNSDPPYQVYLASASAYRPLPDQSGVSADRALTETMHHAFAVQARGLPNAEAKARRVAESVLLPAKEGWEGLVVYVAPFALSGDFDSGPQQQPAPQADPDPSSSEPSSRQGTAGPTEEIMQFNAGEQTTFVYTNHRGETGTRTVIPQVVYWASRDDWHGDGPGWLVRAWDCDRQDFRNFRLDRIATPGPDPRPLTPERPPPKPAEVETLLVEMLARLTAIERLLREKT